MHSKKSCLYDPYLVRMPRRPREFFAGGTYHVYSRGGNRQAIFRFDSD